MTHQGDDAVRDGDGAQPSTVHGHRVYSASQRMLRFVSLLYLGWYILLAASGVAAAALHVLLHIDVYAAIGAVPPTREVAFTSAVMFCIDIAFNLCVAVSAWMASNHPVIARRFRVFAGVLVALSLISLGYAAFFGQLANVASNPYSFVISVLLFHWSSQIAREWERGIATDFGDLTATPSGRRLRIARQVERAIAHHEVPEGSDDK